MGTGWERGCGWGINASTPLLTYGHSRLEYLLTVNSCQWYFSLCRQRFRKLGPYKPREKGPPTALTLGRLIHVLPNPRFEPTPSQLSPSSIIISTPARCPRPLCPSRQATSVVIPQSARCPLPWGSPSSSPLLLLWRGKQGWPHPGAAFVSPTPENVAPFPCRGRPESCAFRH